MQVKKFRLAPASKTLALVADDDPHVDPPRETRCCAVCGAAHASFGFGPPGVLPADAWYCAEHREDGERAWAARYGMRPAGPSGSRLV
jgi:hypothetical protein